MSAVDKVLLALVGTVYAAVADASAWPETLGAIGAAVRCPAVGLFTIDPVSFASRAGTSFGHDRVWLDRYDDYYARPEVNAYARHCEPAMLSVGTIIPAEAVCPDRELLRSEYYNDWQRPQHIGAGALGFVGVPSQPIVLSLGRAPNVGHFDADELALARAVVPHLQRALTVRDRLEGLDAERLATDAALDRLRVGVIMVDALGVPLRLNRRAQALVDMGDGLALRRDGLAAADPTVTCTLRRLVLAAARTTAGTETEWGDTVAVPRPSGRRPLMALVSPVARERWRVGGGFAAAVVLVTDPEDESGPPAAVLRRFHGLTAAEAALAQLLAAGLDLDQSAERLGVTRSTVRTQLARVFAKTGTRRQAELVRLLLLGAGPFLA